MMEMSGIPPIEPIFGTVVSWENREFGTGKSRTTYRRRANATTSKAVILGRRHMEAIPEQLSRAVSINSLGPSLQSLT